MKIAIIGAGFAGLSAAIGLKDHDVTIYEQSDDLRPVGAGVLMQPFGLSVLKQFGLDQEIIEKGNRIERLYGLTTRGKKILNLQYNKYNPEFFGVGIHRGSLFNSLLTKVQQTNTKILTGQRASKIIDHDAKPKIQFEDGTETNSFDLLIIANGSRSTFRSLLTGKKFEQEYPWGALWAVFENKEIDKSTLFQRYNSTTQVLGFLPCGQHPESKKSVVSFFWSLRNTDYKSLIASDINEFKRSLLKYEPSAKSIQDQIDSWKKFTFVTYTDVYIRNWLAGKVLFIGDSAHGMSPQLGLGANMAIYDGWLTGELLKNNHLDKITRLSEIRYKQNLFYHNVSKLMTPFFQSDYKWLGTIRDFVFPLLPHISYLDKLMVETLYGTRDGFFSKRDLIKGNLSLIN